MKGYGLLLGITGQHKVGERSTGRSAGVPMGFPAEAANHRNGRVFREKGMRQGNDRAVGVAERVKGYGRMRASGLGNGRCGGTA